MQKERGADSTKLSRRLLGFALRRLCQMSGWMPVLASVDRRRPASPPLMTAEGALGHGRAHEVFQQDTACLHRLLRGPVEIGSCWAGGDVVDESGVPTSIARLAGCRRVPGEKGRHDACGV